MEPSHGAPDVEQYRIVRTNRGTWWRFALSKCSLEDREALCVGRTTAEARASDRVSKPGQDDGIEL